MGGGRVKKSKVGPKGFKGRGRRKKGKKRRLKMRMRRKK